MKTLIKYNKPMHDFYLKTGALLGRKMKAGHLRIDLFAGGGVRFTFRNHKLLGMVDSKEDWMPCECNTMFSSNEIIYIDSPGGWRTLKPVYYLSLGIGLGIKPVVFPKF